MKSAYLAAAVPLLFVIGATPAAAQSDDLEWTGGYVGVSGGYRIQPSDNKEAVKFDTNLDGIFGDTVATAANPAGNAFSPGFCGGKAKTTAPAGGCFSDEDAFNFGVHAGYDMQFGALVVGTIAEYDRTGMSDSVSAFSTTPAAYVLTRKMKDSANLRLRAGGAIGRVLVYGTGGGVWARVRNSFTTSNTTNTFTDTGNDNVFGWTAGGGAEFRFSETMSLGVQYLYTNLTDDDFRVRAAGGAANNPFIRVNAQGTDFRRGGKFNSNAVAASINFHF